MELANVEAFTELVRRHQAAVAAVAYAIVRDRELAHDLTQEAFVKAWRSLDQLRDPTRAAAWLCGIVRFLARDQRRVDRRRAALREQHVATTAAAATPLDHVVAREDDALVAAVVGDLPESYREPLLLHHVAGCSVSEIAATLELSEDAVKQRLSRGRSALRESLARANADEPRFAAAALALAPPVTFTPAAVDAAIHQAPLGAGKATFMTSHPVLTLTLLAGAVAAGGLAIAATRGADDEAAAPPASTAPANPPDEAPARAGKTHDRAALLQAIRSARARTSGRSVAAPTVASSRVYDFAGETLVAGAEPTPPAEIPDDATLTKSTIRAGLQSARPEVIACYEAALARVPELAGTLTVRVVVEGEPGIGGVISEADVVAVASTVADASLTSCVIDALVAVELPAPEDGVVVTVLYPYTFALR